MHQPQSGDSERNKSQKRHFYRKTVANSFNKYRLREQSESPQPDSLYSYSCLLFSQALEIHIGTGPTMFKPDTPREGIILIKSVQFGSVAQSCPTLCDPMNLSMPGLPISQSPPKPMSIESVMPSSHLILCRPLLLLPSIFPSFRVFSSESALHIRWPTYWSFSFSISPSNEHPGLISLRMDWLDLLAVQRTLKSLVQHHSSKASILLRSAFFIVQLSHPYMTTGKTIALTRWTFVGKVTSLLFNMLSRLVITFLPRSKRLLISSF